MMSRTPLPHNVATEPSGQPRLFQGNFTFLLGSVELNKNWGSDRLAGTGSDHSHGSDDCICVQPRSPKRAAWRSLLPNQ